MVGIISVQGDVREHEDMLSLIGVSHKRVKSAEHLDGVKALVIPGGESTAQGKLMQRSGLLDALRERLRRDPLPVLGTCAGAILLAKQVEGAPIERLGVMDITMVRNAFGRQRESFEAEIKITDVADSFCGVFIRAPLITHWEDGVEVLSPFQGGAVLARQGPFWACCFHPELAADHRLHQTFLQHAGLL